MPSRNTHGLTFSHDRNLSVCDVSIAAKEVRSLYTRRRLFSFILLHLLCMSSFFPKLQLTSRDVCQTKSALHTAAKVYALHSFACKAGTSFFPNIEIHQS